MAYKYGLWSAVRLMGHATDDGFTDFRAWLISQGKEAYFAALKEPDTLAMGTGLRASLMPGITR